MEKVKLISAKGLTNDLINDYSILNSGKHFGENESYSVFKPFSKYSSYYRNTV